MSPTTTFRVFWLSLVVVLPMPCYWQSWGVLPVLAQLQLLVANLWQQGPTVAALMGGLQIAVGLAASALMAQGYVRYTSLWPSRIRGSVMGISVLTALTVLSSTAVYTTPFVAASGMTFLQVYQ